MCLFGGWEREREGVGGGKGSWMGEGELAWNSAHEIFRCLPYLSTSCIICTFVLLIKDISQIRDTRAMYLYLCVSVFPYLGSLRMNRHCAHSVATSWLSSSELFRPQLRPICPFLFPKKRQQPFGSFGVNTVLYGPVRLFGAINIINPRFLPNLQVFFSAKAGLNYLIILPDEYFHFTIMKLPWIF